MQRTSRQVKSVTFLFLVSLCDHYHLHLHNHRGERHHRSRTHYLKHTSLAAVFLIMSPCHCVTISPSLHLGCRSQGGLPTFQGTWPPTSTWMTGRLSFWCASTVYLAGKLAAWRTEETNGGRLSICQLVGQVSLCTLCIRSCFWSSPCSSCSCPSSDVRIPIRTVELGVPADSRQLCPVLAS